MDTRSHLADTLGWAMRRAAAHLGCADLAIFLRDRPSGALVLRTAMRAGQPFPIDYGQRWPLSAGLIGAAARSGVSQVVGDVAGDPRCRVVLARTRAEMAVPLCHDGAIWGVFDVQSPRRDRFGAGDVRFLEGLARRLAATLAGAHGEQLLPILVTTTKIAASLMGCSLGAVYLLDEPEYALALWDGFSLPVRLLARRLCVGEELIERCADAASPVLVADAGVPLDTGTALHHARSVLAVPLIGYQRRVLGVLCSGHAKPSYFTPWHRDLLVAFADRAALEIERAQRPEEVWSAHRA